MRVITSFLSPFFKLKDFIIARDGFSYELKFRSFLNRSKLWDWKLLERSSRLFLKTGERLFVPDGATKTNSEDRGEDTNRKSCFSSLLLRICSFEHRFDSFHLFKTKSRILQSVGDKFSLLTRKDAEKITEYETLIRGISLIGGKKFTERVGAKRIGYRVDR